MSLSLARQAGLFALFAAVALVGTVSGVLFAYSDDLPTITALDDYKPNTITRLLARDGQTVAEFATERRVVISYDDIAPSLRGAILATEDADFNQHFGLSMSRIMVTLAKDVLFGERAGASTLTQQLARNLFPIGFEKTVERKVKEAILAVQIEKRFTKREIFTLYANQIYFGHGAYGVEAAAHLYFDKAARDLTLEESATIAAIIQAPERLSPFVDARRALVRRNYVLGRMADERMITADQASDAAERPLVVHGQASPERGLAPYFAEDIRKVLEQKYGAKALYESGLVVQTTLDPALQESANRALDRGLRRLDKRRGVYRRPQRNLVAEKRTPADYKDPRWTRSMRAGDIVPAVVTSVDGQGGSARVRIGEDEFDLPRTAFTWTRRSNASDLFTVGDLIEVEVRTVSNGAPQTLVLEQRPVVQGAILAIDNATGQIRAMAGGFDFATSKFNRATQARRQMGSAFKPIIYTAAIDRGYTPISTFIDEPVSYPAGPNQPPYAPLNYDRKFVGPITLRRALEDSRNIPAVKALADLGPDTVIRYATRFGFPSNLPPYLSLALGSAESTLVDVTSAYTAFPNHGVRMAPYSIVSITDREGNALLENRPEPREAVRADTAFVMTNLLRGVVEHGTAAAARALEWPLAGKTGTMDEYTDAWFIGFDPRLTIGVWVGYDEKRPLGPNETGGAAALPIWMDVMRTHIETQRTAGGRPDFDAPGNIVFATLQNGNVEAFISGTEPEGITILPALSEDDGAEGGEPLPATAPAPADPR